VLIFRCEKPLRASNFWTSSFRPECGRACLREGFRMPARRGISEGRQSTRGGRLFALPGRSVVGHEEPFQARTLSARVWWKADIADEAFFRVSFGDNLRQTQPLVGQRLLNLSEVLTFAPRSAVNPDRP
jgi:hypothetical protein